MSAYGALPPRESPALPSSRWPLPDGSALTVHHLAASSSSGVPPALGAVLHAWFAAELERGNTYPQEGPISPAAFAAYFLAADLFVAVLHPSGGAELALELDVDVGLDVARAGRRWEDCLCGTYYVKQNYPGRSGHICNAGFLVPPHLRGRGIATALARSYLYYAPRLGYRASVFNLVYVDNVASVRIWERLGFDKIGRVPRAGRLRRTPANGGSGGGGDDGGGDEEYVDAWIIYKSFGAE